MKALKIVLVLAVVLTALTSCTKQDLNEDDVLNAPDTTLIVGDGTIELR
ncbi:hypothetical protein [Gaetbulibacter saemankumensis]|nr:hypothetical protein [Gaetbulibacter saemankumensis]